MAHLAAHWVAALGCVTVLGYVAAGLVSATTVAGAATPRGWKTVGYGTVGVSVPEAWKVLIGATCAGSGTNAVQVGAADQQCAKAARSTSRTTTVYLEPVAVRLGSLKGVAPMTVNGLTVYATSKQSGTTRLWILPGRNVQILAEGPMASTILRTVQGLS